MTLLETENPSDQQRSQHGDQVVLPEFHSEAPPLDERSEDVFTDEMRDFTADLEKNVALFQQMSQSGEHIPNVHQAALQKLYTDRVVHAEFSELSHLSQALYYQLFLPSFQRQLDQMTPRWQELRSKPRSREETEEYRNISAKRQMMKHEVIRCNQALRDTIEFQADRQVNPEVLQEALVKLWGPAKKPEIAPYVRGIQAEIAAAHCIAASGRETTYGGILDDAHGNDIWVMSRSGQRIGYDVKCSPLSSRYGAGTDNPIFIDPIWLDQYSIRPEYIPAVLQQL